MSDLERIRRAKEKADETAYKKGYREGVDATMWGLFMVGTMVAVVLYWLP